MIQCRLFDEYICKFVLQLNNNKIKSCRSIQHVLNSDEDSKIHILLVNLADNSSCFTICLPEVREITLKLPRTTKNKCSEPVGPNTLET